MYRVLPTADSIEKCKTAGVLTQNIIAAVGTFSQKLNEAMFGECGADYVVTKDSGTQGGTYEKLAACAVLNITPLILYRAPEDGINNIDKIEQEILHNENAAY